MPFELLTRNAKEKKERNLPILIVIKKIQTSHLYLATNLGLDEILFGSKSKPQPAF